MARAKNKLTNAQVKNATYKGKAFKLADGDGLTLFVQKSGRYWWFRYRFGGKEKTLSLGVYPDVTLAQARERREEARALLADGIDPSARRKADKEPEPQNDPTLEEATLEWADKQGWSASYRDKILGRLKRHVFPQLGERPITEITPPELLKVLQCIEEQGRVETARRTKQHISGTYKHAIACGYASHNPAEHLSEALRAKPKPNHFAAITEPKALGELLRAIEAYSDTPETKAALFLAPRVFVRPVELRHAEWREISFEDAACNTTTLKWSHHVNPANSRSALSRQVCQRGVSNASMRKSMSSRTFGARWRFDGYTA